MHLDPAFIARTDQYMAEADERLQKYVDRFRYHAAHHTDGEIICPYGEVVLTATIEMADKKDPVFVAEVLAAAVLRLARTTSEEVDQIGSSDR